MVPQTRLTVACRSWYAMRKHPTLFYSILLCFVFVRKNKEISSPMLEMDFWFIAYILISIVLGLAAVSYTYKRGQTISAMLLLVLLIAIFAFYGLRWFQGGSLKGTTGTNIPWPPIVNVCPDFMVSTQALDGAGNKIVYCLDTKNLYGLKSAAATNNLVASNISYNGAQYSGLIMTRGHKGTDVKNLAQDAGKARDDQRYPFLSALRTNLPSVISSVASLKDMRWEGVYDGLTATPDKAPLATPV